MRQLTDANGFVGLSQSFDPFGNLLTQTGAASSSFGFAGEWIDATGLQYLRARYYSPSQGRFLTRDPFPGMLGMPGTMHPYVYGLNNPTLYTDPSGEFVEFIIIGIVGGIIGGLGYYGLQQIFSDDPCARWDWYQAAFWGGAGAVIGAAGVATFFGGWWVGVQLGWWGKTITDYVGADGDPTNEIKSAIQIGQQSLQGIKNIPASSIRFTQNSISPFTRAGVYIDDLTQEIANGFFRGYLRVVEFQGNLYSLDNRRLAAFKLLDVMVPVKIENLSNPAIQEEFLRKFRTITYGLSILIRNTSIIVK